MIEVLSYLIENCDKQQSGIKVRNGSLFFFMGSYQIVLYLNDNYMSQHGTNDLYVDINELTVEEIDDSYIERIYIQCGTYLFIEDGKEQAESLLPYTFIFNKLTAIIDKDYPSFINKYQVGPYRVDDSCLMCDDIWEYGFEISINKLYWMSLDFFQSINRAIKQLSLIKVPSFYSYEIKQFDDYEISILPSNTKARRLGYLKLILQMHIVHPKLPVLSYNRDFEKYAQSFSKYLKIYKNKKGIVVETKTGNSAKPYIELAEKLGLIHKTSFYYELGKMGKVYLSIKQALEKNDDNPFILSDFDKAFILEQILKNDYLYMYSILELICKQSISSYSSLKQFYQNHLLHQISCILDQNNSFDSSKKLKLKILERRIMTWEKPMTYLEHVLMPRINWLLDLGFIEYQNKTDFSLTISGLRCFLNLSTCNDFKMGIVINPASIIDMYYIKIYNDIETNDAKQYTPSLEGKLVYYVNLCFDLFGTIAPNRTTFSLAANYCKYMFYLKDSILLDIEEIKELLSLELSKYYIYKYQIQYKDGYIQKR